MTVLTTGKKKRAFVDETLTMDLRPLAIKIMLVLKLLPPNQKFLYIPGKEKLFSVSFKLFSSLNLALNLFLKARFY